MTGRLSGAAEAESYKIVARPLLLVAIRLPLCHTLSRAHPIHRTNQPFQHNMLQSGLNNSLPMTERPE